LSAGRSPHVPGSHGRGPAEPNVQYEPVGQMVGTTVASGQKYPAGQIPEQVGPDWSSGWYELPTWPAGQTMGKLPSVGPRKKDMMVRP
jgi:hypothetical protein